MTKTSDAIQLPYTPRPQFLPFHLRSQRWALIVAHRRAGKTEACLAELIERALRSQIPNAFYAYVAPFAAQGITVAWERLKRMLGDKLIGKCKVREGDHSIRLPNGSTIRIFGADNYDALRGNGFDGVILDEVGDMHPSAWSLAIRPALMNRQGWAVFIGTPKGRNFFYEQREKARLNKKGNWFYLELKASETGILSQEELDELRDELDEDEYLQEMECSFDAALKGAYYSKEIAKASEEQRLAPFEPIKGAPVHAAFDLGWSDDTAAWFYQFENGRLDVIGYYAVNGLSIPNIVAEIKELYQKKTWKMGEWWMPHDAGAKSLQTGISIIEQLWTLGVRPKLVPNIEVQQGIQATRRTFPFLRIDGNECYHGLEALKSYSKKWNDKAKTYSREPRHDWASHGADAFRYMCLAIGDAAGALSKPLPINGQGLPAINTREDVSVIGDLAEFDDEDREFLLGLAEDAYERF